VPAHTILKKSLDHPSLSEAPGEAGSEAGAVAASVGGFAHSPSLPNRHAKFRDVVEIVEFAEKDQVKTGVHFAHEEQLHDDDDYDDDDAFVVGTVELDDDDDNDELVHSINTPSECSSTTSDDQVSLLRGIQHG